MHSSSDVEFEPAPTKSKGPRGQASIARIIEEADTDRLSSKRTVKQLQFGHGSPGTRANQDLWIQRFNTFRQVTLKQSLAQPFTGDDVIRFFDVIIGKIRPGSRGKPVPNDDVVITGFAVISSYGTFTYSKQSGYKLTRQDGARLQTFLDDAIKAGRLSKGLWQKKVWLNFMTMAQMGRAWLAHHHQHGAWNWDLTLARLMSVVLVTSLGCRAGDASRSRYYSGPEYLQYKDFELRMEGEEPRFENLRARVILRHTKGYKDKRNEDVDLYLRPLNNPKYHHMCPITLLLIHALRHGLVLGSTIEQVLSHAVRAPDSKVIWLFPDHPIVAAFEIKGQRRCVLDKPATVDQLLDSVKQMGIVSNILTRVYTHATRLGTAQDLAHLPSTAEQASGFTTNLVRQGLAHKNSAFQRGLTQSYTGHATRELYNDRVTNEYSNPWGPKFSQESVKEAVERPISEAEIREWQQANEPLADDLDSSNGRRRARYGIRKDRHKIFIETAKPLPKSNRKATGSKLGAMRQKSASDVNVVSNQLLRKESSSEPGSSSVMVRSPSTSEHLSFSLSDSHCHQIDPRLLDDGALDDIRAGIEEKESLRSHLMLDTQPQDEDQGQSSDDQMLATQSLFDDDDDDDQKGDEKQQSACEFITAFAKINVVVKDTFARAWSAYREGRESFDDGIGLVSVRGGSRDDPTPFEYRCKKLPGCPFKAIQRHHLVLHEQVCNHEYVTKANTSIAKKETGSNYACSQEGCTKSFSSQKALEVHTRTVHAFEPKPCPVGCDPDKLYTTYGAYYGHLERNHSGRWPTSCQFPECTSQNQYNNVGAYSRHLRIDHSLVTKAERAPYMPEVTSRKKWAPMICPVDGCTNKTVYMTKYGLKGHICKVHGLTEDEAKVIAADEAVSKWDILEGQLKRKREAVDGDERDDLEV